MIKLEETLTKEFRIMPNKFLKINEDYYLGGKDCLFENKTVKQIQYILFCICLADNRVQVKKERDKNTEYMPDFVEMVIKRSDFKVFKFLYGKHIKEFINMEKSINIKDSSGGYLYTSLEIDDDLHIFVNTKIFRYIENVSYANVWMGDILLTKKKSSVYLKMKIYSFLKIKDFVEETGIIPENSYIKIIISKESFSNWCLCGKRYKQFILETMKSINSENDFKIDGNYTINGSIIFTFNEKSIAEHIKENGIIAYNKYDGKTKAKIITGTW